MSSETKKSRLPTAAEYQLILNLLEGAAKYLYNMDFRRNKDDVQNKDYWKKQILSVKEEFYTVIKYLTKYGKKKVNVQAVQILKLLQQNSLVMSRDLDVGECQRHVFHAPFLTSNFKSSLLFLFEADKGTAISIASLLQPVITNRSAEMTGIISKCK